METPAFLERLVSVVFKTYMVWYVTLSGFRDNWTFFANFKQFCVENFHGKFEFLHVFGHLYILLGYFPLEYDGSKVITQKELIQRLNLDQNLQKYAFFTFFDFSLYSGFQSTWVTAKI